MTKKELISAIQEKAEGRFSHKEIKEIIDTCFDVIAEEVSEGSGEVQIGPLGKIKGFVSQERNAFNPQTKEPIVIPSRKRIKLKVSKKFIEDINN